MDINISLHNQEDILYINQLSNENKNKILESALSIGLRSIQMSEVNFDCHSYLDPIQKIVSESTYKIN